MDKDLMVQNRWRLVLGKYADDALPFLGDGQDQLTEMDDLLDFLYGREYGDDRDILKGDPHSAHLTIPTWLHKIQVLFPKETVEKIEKHALERYELTELLTDARILESLKPNMALLKQILSLKQLMHGEVLVAARRIVAQIAEDLAKNMRLQISNAITGRRNPYTSTQYRCSKNIDFKKTIRKNLKHYDSKAKQIQLHKVYFNQNIRRMHPWHLIICVDASGSMIENVIHASIMAAIFAKIPALSTSLVVFDTNVVDLTGYVDDPVQTLMSVQLGGGTDIGKALAYCERLLTQPNRTIVVLISDLCDGGGFKPLYAHTHSMIEAGVTLLCLTALDAQCAGLYNQNAAKTMAELGASVAALTPTALADWVGGIIGGHA